MKFAKSMLVVGALGVLAACQTNVGAQNAPVASNTNHIALADGREVFFHDGVKFGGFIGKNGFRTQAASDMAALTSVAATYSSAGFVALATMTNTFTAGNTYKVWLLRQGVSFGPVFAAASAGSPPNYLKGETATGPYSAVQSGKNVALTIPASMPAGTYGLAVSTSSGTAADSTANATVKTAFTITDSATTWSNFTYNAGASDVTATFTAQ